MHIMTRGVIRSYEFLTKYACHKSSLTCEEKSQNHPSFAQMRSPPETSKQVRFVLFHRWWRSTRNLTVSTFIMLFWQTGTLVLYLSWSVLSSEIMWIYFMEKKLEQAEESLHHHSPNVFLWLVLGCATSVPASVVNQSWTSEHPTLKNPTCSIKIYKSVN